MRRMAERIGRMAEAQVEIGGNFRRWDVDKIREFLRHEAM